jgi:uncharacterized protein with FMN-binding domain
VKRQTRLNVANGLIAAAALASGVVLTKHFMPSLPGPTSTATPTPTGSTGSTGKNGTATSDSIQYQFGQIQLTVTEKNGKITAIDYGSSTASAGREAAFPYLVKDAISAQGTGFANLSGATYTTAAFKQALDSAVSKIA